MCQVLRGAPPAQRLGTNPESNMTATGVRTEQVSLLKEANIEKGRGSGRKRSWELQEPEKASRRGGICLSLEGGRV